MTIRLAVITNDYPPRPGGIQQYLANLVAAHPGEVLVLGPADGPAADEERVRRHRRRFMLPTPAVLDWATSQLEDFRPDALLFGAPHPLPALAPELRQRLGIPVGVLAHGAEVTVPMAVPGARQVLARWLRAVDVRFAVSRYTAAKVESLTGRPVTFVGAGVDTELFRPATAGARPGPLVVGCVSRFVPRKGQHRLIAAAAELRRRGTDLELLLVGKGRKEGALRAQATREEVPVRFVVDAPWSELPGLYAGIDIFCMPCRSRWGGLEIEGLGLVYLEAAAAGIPVLAGTSGGSPETVVPAETGYVVSSEADIVEAVAMLAADPQRRARLGAAGRRRVEEEATWEAVARRLGEGFAAADHRRQP